MDKETINEINNTDFSKLLLKDYNGLLLTEEQVEVLNRYNIDLASIGSIQELLFVIEEIIEDDPDDTDDLEYISYVLAERSYYELTNK